MNVVKPFGSMNLLDADIASSTVVSQVQDGEVFTKGSGNGTARAVTLTASTGRVKQYWISSGAWVVR